ncbi:hypothetical protein BGI41_07465 [Methanobrevibacter sp. 87.7]|nr:hypothetical protein BGI41_07465 [Methanobrevibacter sp. 87.7]
MRKIIVILIIILMILTPTISAISATTVFLTSDSVFSQKGEEVKMLNEIKHYIEEDSNGEITAVVDPDSPAPGEGTRAMTSDTDVSVFFAFSDAANFYEMAKYSTKVNKQVMHVNLGSLNLDNTSKLRRAWDDNWSDESFESIKQPGEFLRYSGINIIQPVQKYPEDTDENNDMYHSNSTVNKYIADQIIYNIQNANSSDDQLRSDLIIRNNLKVSTIGDISKSIEASKNFGKLENNYESYTTPQALYLLSSYLSGDGLNSPKNYEAPDNPQNYSIGTKSSYSIYDYESMAQKVVDYMDKTGKAPDYIEYEGAKIGYNDLLYNFALLTDDDQNAGTMNLPKSSDFKSFNDMNLVYTAIPILVIIGIILLIIGIRRKRRR